MKRPRVYADTSVFGGCFDEGFAEASSKFFDLVRDGRLRLVISAVTAEELGAAPEHVRAVLDRVSREHLEYHEVTAEMERLRDAYLEAGVLGQTSDADALHVAAATALDVDMLVSWNFKHIVHYDKIRGFNAVNRLNGYKLVEIYSPLEVVEP